MDDKKKARLALMLVFLTLLTASCTKPAENGNVEKPAENSRQTASSSLQRFQTSNMTLFDTVTTVVGYAPDEKTFQEEVNGMFRKMEEMDHLYDIYNDWDGINNLKTVNDQAGTSVTVDQRIIDLLRFARNVDDFSHHRVNVTLGSVLTLWHACREAGIRDPEHAALPDRGELEDAAEHTGFNLLELDTEKRTVLLTDPAARLDVGALAKGYAVQKACEDLPEGYLISAGGNVLATGPKPDGTPWTIGITDPDDAAGGIVQKVALTSGAVVTSGDYQRYYSVEGVRYHHIIDPETLYPADKWRSVTVLCPDSGLGDALSTSLFLMNREEGQALLTSYGAEAFWIASDGSQYFSPGYEASVIR